MATKGVITSLIVAAVLFVLLGIPGAAADTADGDEDECWGGGMEFNSWGFWLGLMMLSMVCGVILMFAFFRTRNDAQSVNGAITRETALSILDQRYARGELPKHEYLTMKDDLKRSP